MLRKTKQRVMQTRENILSKWVSFARGSKQTVSLTLTALCGLANAAYDVNIPAPATPIASQIYDLHMLILGVCVVIFVLVFGAMFYSLFKFRKSKGAKAATWHENTFVEVLWTVIPFLILVGMAYPATKTVLDMKDSSNPDMTVTITAYQWKWSYEYAAEGFKYYSQLSTPRDQIDEYGKPGAPKGPNYLLEVDNEMVVPVGKRVRLLITSADVIHGWYVPTLGVNQYGIPGFIKDAWISVTAPGVYRGQCSQICGKEHGYMPIVVRALSESDYKAWVKDMQAKHGKKSDGTATTSTTAATQAASSVATTAPEAAKILFEINKSALPATGGDSIKSLVEYAKTNPNTGLYISGFTDKTGDPAKNAELAKERAKSVREALKSGGIVEDRIEMRKPGAITGAANDDEARRVEVGVVSAATAAGDDVNKKWDLAELKSKGEQVYAANCQACHQATGMGIGAFPALNGSKVVNGAKNDQIALLLNGKAGTAMASFSRLTDVELAAVATYTRNAWNNKSTEAIQPGEIKSQRK